MTTIELIAAIAGSSFVSTIATYLTTRRAQTLSSEDKTRETILQILAEERAENATCEERVTFLTGRVEVLLIDNTSLTQKVTSQSQQITDQSLQIADLMDTVNNLREVVLAHYSATV